MKSKRWPALAVGLFVAARIVMSAGTAAAQFSYIENFATNQYKDVGNTAALWDTTVGELKLPPFTPWLVGSYDAPDDAYGVFVDGDLVYLADAVSGLEVFDMTDPSNPSLIGNYDTPDFAHGVFVSGDHAYVADRTGGLQVIDVSDPANPSLAGNYDTPTNAWSVFVNGNYAYVADSDSGLYAIDVSDPTTPTQVGRYATSGDAYGVWADGEVLYLADRSGGLWVFDISDPSAPELNTSIPLVEARDVCSAGGYAYVADWNLGLVVIDEFFQPVDTLSTPGNAYDVFVTGNYAYVADRTGGLQVVNISDPTAVVSEGSYDFGDHAYGIFVSGPMAYVGGYQAGLQVINIAGVIPELISQDPLVVGSYKTPSAAYDVVVDGDYAYVTDDDGLHVLDIANPNPVLLNSYTAIDRGRGLAYSRPFIFVAARNDGLQILNRTHGDPYVEFLGSAHVPGAAFDVKVAGEYAFVAAYDSGLVVVDVANPNSPTVVDAYYTGDYSRGIALHGDYAFLASGANGVQVFDISDPTNVVNVDGYNLGITSVSDIVVAGDVAYYADSGSGLRILSILDPTTVQNMGGPGSPGAAYGLALDGDYLYLAALSNMTWMYDVTLAGDPQTLGAWAYADQDYNLAVSGDRLYMAHGTAGLRIEQVYEREFSIADDTAQSKKINTVDELIMEVSLLTTPASIAGVTWQVSANGGANWQTITPSGTYNPIGVPGTDLRWRADWLYGSPGVNPTCDELTLDYVIGQIDGDNDGVEDGGDACPAVSAAYFDRDGDGCVDATNDLRHVEYWPGNFTYYVHLDGAPGITDLSDLAAVEAAFDTWMATPGFDAAAQATYGGTVDWNTAVPGDRDNLVTWSDHDYDFGPHVLAVGVATSFTEPTYHIDRWYRPGEIVDADMIFNPAKSFKTDSQGEGVDIQSVATHEAGHLFGISHTAIMDATMFYVLPPGTRARTLESDDIMTMERAYPDPVWLASANQVFGRVETFDAQPVPGALVFLIDNVVPDTLACALTLPDGGFQFVGVPFGAYILSVYPMNGTSPIGYLQPGYVNWAADSMAVTDFVPEYWSSPESSSDDPQLATQITVDGNPLPGHVFVLNVDETGPTVVNESPAADAVDVRVDAAVVVTFDEAINSATIPANFRLENTGSGSGVGGNVVLTGDGKLLAFTPFDLLAYSTTYVCSLRAGIEDNFGNVLGTPYVFQFTTEIEPDLNVRSMVPNKGVIDAVVVISGVGFDTIPSGNTVTFTDEAGTGTVNADVSDASQNRLVVHVPVGAGTGNVTVTANALTSDPVSFSVLPSAELARGYTVGTVDLGVLPRSVVVTPDGVEAYVATSDGLSVVNVDPGSGGFLSHTVIPIDGGLDEVESAPDGKWIYAVSENDGSVYVVDPVGQVVDDTLVVGAIPRGVVTDPPGDRVYVPTDEGEIQVWDVQEGSATYRELVGAIASPDPNIRGKMAIDPAGDFLLAPTGNGKLLVFDLGPDTFLVDIGVGPNPKDVAVDPLGERAYVSDEKGMVTVVNLEGLFKVQDIPAAGSLRGIAISPAGLYVYAANRELNLLDVIDLNESNRTYRSVAASVDMGINPTDVDLTPDGVYAVTLVEQSTELVVTGVGAGPTLHSLSRRAGPDSTVLVLAGEGFGADPGAVEVNFSRADGAVTSVSAEWMTDISLAVRVPATAVSGPVNLTLDEGSETTGSNSLYFEVLGGTSGVLRLAAQFSYHTEITVSEVIAMAPLGDVLLVGADNGVMFVDTHTDSATYMDVIHQVTLGSVQPSDIAITPDGNRAYVSHKADAAVFVLNCDRTDAAFGSVIGNVDFSGFALGAPTEIAVSPDGRTCLISDSTQNWVYTVDITPGSIYENAATDTVHVAGVSDIAFHPLGTHAFLTLKGDQQLTSIDMDPASPDFLTRVNTIGFPHPVEPLSLSFYPTGSRCVVYADYLPDVFHWLFLVDTADPATMAHVFDWTHGQGPLQFPADSGERVDVSPKGDHMVAFQSGLALYSWPIDDSGPTDNFSNIPQYGLANRLGQEYAIDGSLVYTASTEHDRIEIYDFLASATMSIASGDGQAAVAGSTLPAPLRVKVVDGSDPVSGVAIIFEVKNGDGSFVETNDATQIVTTGPNGTAEVVWTLGAAVGTQTVEAKAHGLVNSPLTFTAEAIVDPNTLPLELVDIKPVDAAAGVRATTTIVAVFSRPVNPITLHDFSFYLTKAGDSERVAVEYGVADNGRRVSITPSDDLEPDTSYTFEVTGAVYDLAGAPLQNPASISFTTEPPPPLELRSVSPRGAKKHVNVVLAGTGFDPNPQYNTVYFNDVPAVPYGGSSDHLKVEVPTDAETGTVRVHNGSEESNEIPFSVLVSSGAASDEVVATVGARAATKSVTINPDGTMAFAVSPQSHLVIPIDMITGESLPGIPVGNHPISIDIEPEGKFVYVPNYESNTLSVIDVDSDSPNYLQVVETLEVGIQPVDVVVGPDGDRVYVVNVGPDDLANVDVIDSDGGSANYHTVVATVGAGGKVKTVTINPDGGLLYLGTDEGYVVMQAADYSYSVVATVKTGASTKSVTINPDGSILFILTTEGDVLLVDILQGSPNQDQVVATVKGTSKVKTMTINPDGTLLYLIQEEFDIVMIVQIDIYGSVSVLDPDASVPPFLVETTVIDSLFAGEDPEAIVFDPTGNGVALVTNSGPQTVTFLNASFAGILVAADSIMVPGGDDVPIIDLPDFDITNTSHNPLAYEYTLSTVGPATLSTGGDTSSPGQTRGRRSDRSFVSAFETDSSSVTGTIPELAPGDTFAVPPMVLHVPEIREYVEQFVIYEVAPAGNPNLVTSFSLKVTFEPPVPVFINAFRAEASDAGVRLLWEVLADVDVEGYRVRRRETGNAKDEYATGDGLIAADAREFVDNGARGGREYEYTLVVVLAEGDDVLSSPVTVKTRALKLTLEQNHPNPFNPKTTIGFTLPAKQHVTLSVYNVAGQRVTTLVDAVLTEGYKTVAWEGVNSSGNAVGSGVYFYRLQTGKKTLTKKMVLLK